MQTRPAASRRQPVSLDSALSNTRTRATCHQRQSGPRTVEFVRYGVVKSVSTSPSSTVSVHVEESVVTVIVSDGVGDRRTSPLLSWRACNLAIIGIIVKRQAGRQARDSIGERLIARDGNGECAAVSDAQRSRVVADGGRNRVNVCAGGLNASAGPIRRFVLVEDAPLKIVVGAFLQAGNRARIAAVVARRPVLTI